MCLKKDSKGINNVLNRDQSTVQLPILIDSSSKYHNYAVDILSLPSCKNMANQLTKEEKQILLSLARNVIREVLIEQKKPPLDLSQYPKSLVEHGACFVTITKEGVLRGCVGSIEPIQPLILDVQDRAHAAAFQDYRFPPLNKSELDQIKIEISRLTPPKKVEYHDPLELPDLIRPHKDGLILSYQGRRATFLPQVWEKLSSPEMFLDRLCIKMGQDQSLWRRIALDAETYQVEKFSEGDD
jgi:AmmeMemoRadiSam system protein A